MPGPDDLYRRDIPTACFTPRLRLQALTTGDGPALFDAVRESRGTLYPWLAVGQAIKTADDAEALARQLWGYFLTRQQFHFGIWPRHDRRLAGCICLHYGRWDVPCFEVGCWVRSGMEGQGFATEATRGILDFGFGALDLARIEIRFDHRNLRSQAVVERLGFSFEGRLRAYVRALDGALVDELVYALLREEWSS